MNFTRLTKYFSVITFVFAPIFNATAQNLNSNIQSHSNYAAISTALPFLRVAPDARSASMGEAGVALKPDANTLSINPSKLVFMESTSGLAVSYNPWLKNIAEDMNLSYVSAYLNSGTHAVGASIRYFSVGEIAYTDENALTVGKLHPVEYAFDLSYARKFGPGFSMATSLRYAQSRLALNEQGTSLDASERAIAVDISAYMNRHQTIAGFDGTLSAGINLSNIGVPLMGRSIAEKEFLPSNLRVGAAASISMDEVSALSFALDLNKLLVPVQAGTFPTSLWQSFRDAPGGFKEELAEVSLSAGVEFLFKQQFALRTGYILEHPEKGNRRYLSFGAGLKFGTWNADVAYISANTEKSPMANTLKITLMLNFGQLDNNYLRY